MASARPMPRLDADNRTFWTGGAEGELRLMRCQDCSGFIHPPKPVCRHCLSENVKPEAVAGTGELHAREAEDHIGARVVACGAVFDRGYVVSGAVLRRRDVGSPVVYAVGFRLVGSP